MILCGAGAGSAFSRGGGRDLGGECGRRHRPANVARPASFDRPRSSLRARGPWPPRTSIAPGSAPGGPTPRPVPSMGMQECPPATGDPPTAPPSDLPRGPRIGSPSDPTPGTQRWTHPGPSVVRPTYLQRFAVPFEYPVHFTRRVFAPDNPLLAEVIDRLGENAAPPGASCTSTPAWRRPTRACRRGSRSTSTPARERLELAAPPADRPRRRGGQGRLGRRPRRDVDHRQPAPGPPELRHRRRRRRRAGHGGLRHVHRASRAAAGPRADHHAGPERRGRRRQERHERARA